MVLCQNLINANNSKKGKRNIMKPSTHETNFTELLTSLPTDELGQELVRLTIQHDVSLEAVNNLAAFFARIETERRLGEAATHTNENQLDLFRADL